MGAPCADWPASNIPTPDSVVGDWVRLAVPADGETAYGQPVTVPEGTVGRVCGPWPTADVPDGTLLVAVAGDTTTVVLPVTRHQVESLDVDDIAHIIGPGDGYPDVDGEK